MPDPKLTRRAVLQSGALALAAVGCDPAPTDEPPPDPPSPAPDRGPEPDELWAPPGTEDPALFPLGVQSGDPTTDAVIVWTRYLGPDALTLELASGTEAWAAVDSIAVTADLRGVVKFDLTGLEVDTAYAFAFVDAAGARSLSGRFRTAANTARRLVFGASSCTDNAEAPFPCLSYALPERLDFFLLLGDTVYCDGSQNGEQYSGCWSANYRTQGYLDLRRSTSTVMTWDDHEVENVNVGEWDVPADIMEAAAQEFWRYNTVRRDPANPTRLWRKLSFGPGLDLFVLDCRSERDRDARQYISPEQMDWFKAELSASDATFKVVLNSVPIAGITNQEASNGAYASFADDRWEGYPEQRSEILDHIVDEGITGVTWVSGDLHFPAIMDLEVEGPYAGMVDILAGPAGNGPVGLTALFEDAPPFHWWANEMNWVRFDLDPSLGTLEVAFISEQGEVLYSEVFTA